MTKCHRKRKTAKKDNAQRSNPMPLKLIEIYVHSSKESAYDECEKAGLTGEALAMGKYLGTEHKMEYVVSTETGQATLIAVDGCPVGSPTKYFVVTDMETGNVVDFHGAKKQA